MGALLNVVGYFVRRKVEPLQEQVTLLSDTNLEVLSAANEAIGAVADIRNFRQWSSAHSYNAYDSVFYLGLPYYANPDNLPLIGQSPNDVPEKWIRSGGSGGNSASEQATQNQRRIEALWNAVFGANTAAIPLAVFFDNLDGIVLTRGVWNKAQQMLEC
jgi:hypothetical protein